MAASESRTGSSPGQRPGKHAAPGGQVPEGVGLSRPSPARPGAGPPSLPAGTRTRPRRRGGTTALPGRRRPLGLCGGRTAPAGSQGEEVPPEDTPEAGQCQQTAGRGWKARVQESLSLVGAGWWGPHILAQRGPEMPGPQCPRGLDPKTKKTERFCSLELITISMKTGFISLDI